MIMASFRFQTSGNLVTFKESVQKMTRALSMSVTQEEDIQVNEHTYLLGFERYSMTGSNRISLTLVISQNGSTIDLVAISTGGSQAKLFKFNTFGESQFIIDFERALERLPQTW